MSTYQETLNVKEMPEKWLLVFLIVGCTSLIFVVCFPIDFCLYRRRKKQLRERKKEAMFKSQMVVRAGQYHANVSTSQIVDYFVLESENKEEALTGQRKVNGFARLVNLFRKKRQEELLLQMQKVHDKSNTNQGNPAIAESTDTTENLNYPTVEHQTETTQTEVAITDVQDESSDTDEARHENDVESVDYPASALMYRESDDLVDPEGKYTTYGAIGISKDLGKPDSGLIKNDSYGGHLEEKRVVLYTGESSGADETSTDTVEERESKDRESSVVIELDKPEEVTQEEDEGSKANVINVVAEVSEVRNERPKQDMEDFSKLETSISVDITGFQRKQKANFSHFLQPLNEDKNTWNAQNGIQFRNGSEQTRVTSRAISENCLTIGVNHSKVVSLTASSSLNTLPQIQNYRYPELNFKNKRTGSTISAPDVESLGNGRWRKKTKQNGGFLKKETSMPELHADDREGVESDDLFSHDVWTTLETHE